MKPTKLLSLSLVIAALGCNATPHSQEQVRRDTADATATIKSDVKSAALGIRDGLKRDVKSDAVNINAASRPTLETLNGITPQLAGQIVAHRPYANAEQLRQKRILTRDQYDKIAGRLTVAN